MFIYWFFFSLYCLTALVIGFWPSKKKTKDDCFWTAGRNLNGFSAGISISAGFMSVSWSCVYAVQLFYWYGVGAIWIMTIPWLLSLGLIYVLASRYRKLSAFSQPEMVGNAFGESTKRWVAVALIFVFLVWGGAEIFIAAKLLAPGLGISTALTIFLISLVVGLYSSAGGFGAVVSTDKLQYTLVALYILIIAGLAYVGLGDEVSIKVLISQRGMKDTGVSHILFSPGILIIATTFLAYIPGWAFETDLWIRVQASRDPAAAKKSILFAGINAFLFVGVIPLFIGLSALQIFPAVNGSYPEILGYEGDAIFSALVGQFAPSWVIPILILGLVAAAMSTIDTCVHVIALGLSYDLKIIPKHKHRTSVIIAVLASFIFALNADSLWDIFYLSSGILTTAVAFPVAAIFISNVNKNGVTWSSAFGLIGTIMSYFLEKHSILDMLLPAALAGSGLGFILIGILLAILGYLIGRSSLVS